MPEAKHAKPASLLSNPVADIFARSADQWFATQAALLADVDALTHAWLHRRRESVDAVWSRLRRREVGFPVYCTTGVFRSGFRLATPYELAKGSS